MLHSISAVIIGIPEEDVTGVMYQRALQARGVAVRWITMRDMLQAIVTDAGETLIDRSLHFRSDAHTSAERFSFREDVLQGAQMAFLVSNQFPFYSTTVNRVVTASGVVMPNDPLAVHRANDKWSTFEILHLANLATPFSHLVGDHEQASVSAEKLGFPLVMKQRDGNRGDNVVLVRTEGELFGAFDALKIADESLILQQYIECGATDKRVIVIDGKFVAAMSRHAREGDFRSNIAQGGVARPCELSDVELRLALDVAEALGLRFAGLDIGVVSQVLAGREALTVGQPFCLEANAMPALDLPLVHAGVDGSELLVDVLLGQIQSDKSTFDIDSKGV